METRQQTEERYKTGEYEPIVLRTFHWDNIDYDYPSCGGTKGTVYADGRVIIEHESNMQDTVTGDRAIWQLHTDALAALIADPDAAYNDYNTWAEMIEGDGIAYVADYCGETRKGILVE